MSIEGSNEKHAHEHSGEKTVEDVGEFAVRLYISSPTVFQIRSEKKILQTPHKEIENSF